MSSTPFILNDDYASPQNVSAKDLNRRAKISAVQLGGVLKTIGAGVSRDPETLFDSLLVFSDNGTVTVKQGSGFVADANGNVYSFRTEQDTSITPISGTQCYVYAEYIEPAADADNAVTPPVDDTDTTGTINFVVDESDSLANAIQLASISDTGVITDTREFVRWDTTAQEMIDVLEWLGYDSSIYSNKGSVSARLDALSGEESGATTITYLSQLKYSEADPRNAVTVIEEKLAANLAAALAAAASGGVVPSTTETDQIWTWLLAFRNILGIQAPNLLRLQLGAGAMPGLHGTDSAPETTSYDEGGTLPAIPEEREYDSR